MEKKYQIFISSTYEDLKEERRNIQDMILKLEHFPVGMEMFSSADEDQWAVIEKTISSTDYYILIVGHRYGSVIDTGEYQGISYTHREFRYALEKKIPVLAFLVSDKATVTIDKIENNEGNKEKLKSFVEEIKKNRIVEWWDNKEDLVKKVSIALSKQMNRGERPGWVRQGEIDIEKMMGVNIRLNQKVDILEKENIELKKQVVFKSPKFKLLINGKNEITIPFTSIDTEFIKRRYLPLTEQDIIPYKSEITRKDIEEYNNSLPSDKEINDYIEGYKLAANIEKNKKIFKISCENIGNQQAEDLHISITFPKELLIMGKDEAESTVAPDEPKVRDNPIEKVIKRRMGIGALEIISNLGQNNRLGYNFEKSVLQNIRPFKVFNYMERIDDNCLYISRNKLIHTYKMNSDEYYLIPLTKGKFEIEVRVICKELAEETVETFSVIAE